MISSVLFEENPKKPIERQIIIIKKDDYNIMNPFPESMSSI
jgi:hypothetical protein